ncbi:GNAT family N-acetyltransferase [Paenibacillus sp. alder61]|uniref:GNAT family N-acetyltransferase n=1 Tax=Paenibacillus faecis TaxID=862114 RepID=A0A5D0CXP1_9BACL|nr:MULTISPECIES: GNAT family protein [Paenibacillus]MCA1295448.1 GNAT family N-acetyltransferase [Paenibacillus sp. alder61]TYA14483.1 GNAT family N-acetyltransferase [Paenibacillus faecis]
MILNGRSVNLSRVTVDDLDFISELECNKDIWVYEEYVESDRATVRADYLEKMDSDTGYDFVVTADIDGKHERIGLAQIWSYVDHRNSWELGFAILPSYQRQGYGAEATKLLLDFAFRQLQAHKVVGMCHCHNLKSVKLMERAGMRREGIFQEELLLDGQWHDQYFYSILDKEYIKKYAMELD